jgi:hypothetical protein
MPRNISIDRTS